MKILDLKSVVKPLVVSLLSFGVMAPVPAMAKDHISRYQYLLIAAFASVWCPPHGRCRRDIAAIASVWCPPHGRYRRDIAVASIWRPPRRRFRYSKAAFALIWCPPETLSSMQGIVLEGLGLPVQSERYRTRRSRCPARAHVGT